jgi:hypothetical protein
MPNKKSKNKKINGGGYSAADYGVKVWGGFDQVNDPSQGNVIKAIGMQQQQVQQSGGSRRKRYKKIKGGDGAAPFVIPSGDIPTSSPVPTSTSISSQISTLLTNSTNVLNSATTQLANTNSISVLNAATSTTPNTNINSQSVVGGGRNKEKTQKTKKMKKRKQRKSKKRF